MKQAKKPTLAQKKIIQAAKLNWWNWLVISDKADILVIQNKASEKIREIKKS